MGKPLPVRMSSEIGGLPNGVLSVQMIRALKDYSLELFIEREIHLWATLLGKPCTWKQ